VVVVEAAVTTVVSMVAGMEVGTAVVMVVGMAGGISKASARGLPRRRFWTSMACRSRSRRAPSPSRS
jgi:hypothetical protein